MMITFWKIVVYKAEGKSKAITQCQSHREQFFNSREKSVNGGDVCRGAGEQLTSRIVFIKTKEGLTEAGPKYIA